MRGRQRPRAHTAGRNVGTRRRTPCIWLPSNFCHRPMRIGCTLPRKACRFRWRNANRAGRSLCTSGRFPHNPCTSALCLWNRSAGTGFPAPCSISGIPCKHQCIAASLSKPSGSLKIPPAFSALNAGPISNISTLSAKIFVKMLCIRSTQSRLCYRDCS
jgi:hypothetical protein